MRGLVFLIFYFFASTNVYADDIRFFKDLSNERSGFTLEERVLGGSCFTLKSSSLGFSCNPSFLSFEKKSQLRTNFLVDESLDKVYDVHESLRQNDPTRLVRVLNQDWSSPIYSKVTTSIWYQSENGWAFYYVPLKISLISLSKNPSLAEMTFHAESYSEVGFSFGSSFGSNENLKWGLGFKYLEGDYVRESFFLIDAIANSELIQPKKLNHFYLNPGLSFHWDNEIKSTVSLSIQNISISDKKNEVQSPLVYEMGYSSEHLIFGNVLRQGLHLTMRADAYDFRERLKWSFIYEPFETGAFSFKLGQNETSFGYLGHLDSLTYGLALESQVITVNRSAFYQKTQGIFEIGLVF